MLGALSEKLQSVISKISGQKKLTEENISEAVNEVRLALLEADVNYGVTKNFVKRVKEKALGDVVIKSVTPGQQFIKVVHDELASLMGSEESDLNFTRKPAVLMLCGLQGSGKTTHAVKLAAFLKKKQKFSRPLIAACDLQRPAAVDQLETLAKQASVDVFALRETKDPIFVANAALLFAKENGHDLVIVDTAGRLHIDDELMMQLKKIRDVVSPEEILFVANATTGQDAVKTASEFKRHIEFTGSILTMLDGNARGGAAISIREVTGKPLKFEGIGERIQDIQVFNPLSMADRILGMGDTINLVKAAQEHIDETEAKKLEQKIRSATYTYDDYLKQIQMVKKMGSIKGLLKMIPGMSQLKGFDFDEKEFFKVEAMILSMTLQERMEKCELQVSRRKRIAKGSGTTLEEVNKLIKSFKQTKQFFKNMPGMKQLEKLMGGAIWR